MVRAHLTPLYQVTPSFKTTHHQHGHVLIIALQLYSQQFVRPVTNLAQENQAAMGALSRRSDQNCTITIML